MREKLIAHRQYITTYGDDMPEVKNWKWASAVTHVERPHDAEQE
jgi:xylulose-5-phosphate/fructose-6-phosphate phosphoketolase